tara:strand:+ start:824 stop:1060 length:237 start_codon:yes stop_codon:yes gene_type:complete
MKLSNETIQALVIAAIPLSLVGLFAFAGTREPSREVRTGSKLCSELRHEVDVSVPYGLLTQQEADDIVSRCYRLFGDK